MRGGWLALGATIVVVAACGRGVPAVEPDGGSPAAMSREVVGAQPSAPPATTPPNSARLSVAKVADISVETFASWHQARQRSVLLAPIDMAGRDPAQRYVVDGHVVDGVVCVSRPWGSTAGQDARPIEELGPSGCAGFAVDTSALGDTVVSSNGADARRYVGTFDGTTFTILEPPGEVTDDLEPADPRDNPFFHWTDHRAECDTPRGDFSMTSSDLTLFDTNKYPQQWKVLPDFVGSHTATNRLDGSRISVSAMLEALGIDPATMGSFPIPPLVVLTFATSDPVELAARKEAARAVYGGAVCVIGTPTDPDAVADLLAGLHASLASENARRIGGGGAGEQTPESLGDTRDVSFDGLTFTAQVVIADDVTRAYLAGANPSATPLRLDGVLRAMP